MMWHFDVKFVGKVFISLLVLLSLIFPPFSDNILVSAQLGSREEQLININKYSNICVFLAPPILQHFKINIHFKSAVHSPQFKWTKHGYMSLSPPNFNPIIDITICMDVASNPGPSSSSDAGLSSNNGLKVLLMHAVLKHSRHLMMAEDMFAR